ncbi:mitochondrial fission 1 protein A-like isoform X2 [Rutidosis leptorrhynchoides]|uniref:mitochondrial fission 1 protein A-like isoform X2 n=1 Tax=Rutidosis leptorrhynchoides TaxID=125765 RepID=UPI003A9A6120
MLQKKLPAGNFFGTDSNPLYDSNIIARYEREVDEAEKESSEERINECLLQLSRARVHSKRHKDVELGIAMLEGSMNCTSDILQFQRIIYLLAVGLYRRGDYSRSRHLADHCLKFVPDWREAKNLKKAIEDCIKKDLRK